MCLKRPWHALGRFLERFERPVGVVGHQEVLEGVGTPLTVLHTLRGLCKVYEGLDRPWKVFETPLTCARTSLQNLTIPMTIIGRRWCRPSKVLDTFGNWLNA